MCLCWLTCTVVRFGGHAAEFKLSIANVHLVVGKFNLMSTYMSRHPTDVNRWTQSSDYCRWKLVGRGIPQVLKMSTQGKHPAAEILMYLSSITLEAVYSNAPSACCICYTDVFNGQATSDTNAVWAHGVRLGCWYTRSKCSFAQAIRSCLWNLLETPCIAKAMCWTKWLLVERASGHRHLSS